MSVFDFQELIADVTKETSVEGSVYVLLSGLSRELSSIATNSKTIKHDLNSFMSEINIHSQDLGKAVATGITNT